MQQKKFRAGDIVRLKSGGPDMTVQKTFPDIIVTEDEHGQEVKRQYTICLCYWFSSKKLEEGRFGEATLEVVPPKINFEEAEIVFK